jgi:hypothetical protein
LDAEIGKIDARRDAVILRIVDEVKLLEMVLDENGLLGNNGQALLSSCPYCGGEDMDWDDEKGEWVCGSK